MATWQQYKKMVFKQSSKSEEDEEDRLKKLREEQAKKLPTASEQKKESNKQEEVKIAKTKEELLESLKNSQTITSPTEQMALKKAQEEYNNSLSPVAKLNQLKTQKEVLNEIFPDAQNEGLTETEIKNTVKGLKSENQNKLVKTIKENIEKKNYALEKLGSGITKGITGIAQAGLTDAAYQAQLGEQGKKATTIYDIPGAVSENISILKNDNLNAWQKATNLGLTATSNFINSIPAKQAFNEIFSIAGKINPNVDEDLIKFDNQISKPLEKWSQKLSEKGSKLDKTTQFLGDTVEVVGNMAPSIAASYLSGNPNVGLAVMGVSAKGQATQEALNAGADLGTSVKIGDTKGLLEVGTEMLTGGLKVFGKRTLDKALEGIVDKKVKNEVLNFVAKNVLGIMGEQAEEIISDLVGYAIDKGTIDPNATYTWKDLLNTILQTAASTGLLNASTGGYSKSAYLQNAAKMQQAPIVNQENSYSNKLKQQATEEINNSNAPEASKKIMLEALDKIDNVTDNDMEAIRKTVEAYETTQETATESNELETKGDYKNDQARRQKYAQYKNDTSKYDSTVVNEVLDIIPENRSGRRTVKQWLNAANEIGKRISNLSNEEIEKIAYKSWFDLQPTKSITQYDNVAKQKVGFQKFTSDEWVNTINKAVNEARANNQVQENTNELPLVNEENAVVKESIDTNIPRNLVETAKKYNLNYKDTNLSEIQKSLENKGIETRFDDTEFSNKNEGAKWKLTRDENGNVKREIILNPNANEKTVVQEMAIHELTHDIVAKNTKTSEKLYNEVKEWLSKDNQYQEQLENLKDIYGENLAEEEAIAKTLQTKFGTQEEINNLVNYNPSIARKIYDWVVDKLNKITGGKIEKLCWEDIKNKFERAYSEEGNYNDLSTKYSISTDGKMQNNKTGKKVTLDAETGSNNKTLLAIHNLSEEKLRGVLELGGFPVPSIAITNPDINSHEEFGDISVVFNKNTINPKNSKNEVYDRDVWSPTFPAIEYEANKDNINEIRKTLGIESKSYSELDAIQKDAIRDLDTQYIERALERGGLEDLKNYIKDNKAIQYAYLKAKGLIEPTMKQVQFNKDVSNEVLQEFLDNYKSDIPLNELSYEQTLELKDEVKSIVKPYLESLYSKYGKDGKEVIQKELEKYDNYSGLNKFIYSANSMLNNGLNATEIDEDATFTKASGLLNKEDYDKWVDNNITDAIIKDKGFDNGKERLTELGNRRSFKSTHYAVTLENLVKALSRKQTKGGQEVGIFGSNFGRISAKTSNRFKSISDIKNNETRLMTREQAEEIIKPLSEGLFTKIDNLANYSTRKDYGSDLVNHMQGVDTATEIVEEFAGGNLTEDRFRKILSEYYYMDNENIPSELLNGIIDDLKEMKKLPTDYFEAKPQRAVGFDEIDAIVIPSDLSIDLKQQLKDMGIKTIEYDRNNKTEKANILKSLNEYKFSKTTQNFDKYLENRIGKKGTRTTLGELRSTYNAAPTADNVLATSEYTKNKTMNPTEIANTSKESMNTTPKLETKNYKVGNKQSSFVSNILNDAQFLNKDLRQEMSKDENIRYYEGITNAETLEKAYNSLKEGGENAVLKWANSTQDGKNISAEDVAKGWILLKQYQDAGDYQSAVEVAKKMRQMGTKAGQAVQAYNIMARLTPEGMFYYAQSELNEAYNKMVEGKSKQWIEKNQDKFTLTPEETQTIIDTMKEISELPDGREKTVKLAQIQKLVSSKIPPTAGQSIKAWMRISMLFNPKTQVRNVMGNTVIAPVNLVSDAFSGIIDEAIAKKTGVRTTGITTKGLKGYAKGFKKGLFESYDDFKKGINTRNVQGDKFEIGEGLSFKDEGLGKALNKVDNILTFALDAGDRGFYEASFLNSLNNQMVLNDTTEVTQDMIDIATNEALQRTWQDDNKYTQSVLAIRRILNNVNVKGYGLGDVLIPFAKTPANLTKAIFDYSPVGLAKTLTTDAKKFNNSLKNGQYSPQLQHNFVQNLGKGMAGSVLYVLGYALAKAGIATGESDDDKDVKNFMKNSLGISSYSIKIGDKTFTYDWAQPVAVPLSIMTNYVKYSKDNPDATAIDKAIKSLDIGTEQLLQQSFMESLNTVLNGSGSTMENLSKALLDLPARAVPTFSKQIADMVDSTQRSSFEYGQPIQSAINSVIAKIPFASKTLPAAKDTLGNDIKKYGGENNLFNVMLNPANVNKGQLSKAGEEIYNVYLQTGDTTIFPRTAPYYINSKGEKINLFAKQKNDFQEVSGKYVNDTLSSLLNDKDYQKLSDDEKADLINEIVDDSYAKAKYDILGIDSTTYEKKRNTLKDVKPSSYYSYKLKTKEMKTDNEKIDVLLNSNYTKKEKSAIYENYINSDDSKYQLLKTTGIDIDKYLEYKNFTGTKKAEKLEYIENMKGLSYTQKVLLYGYGANYKLSDSQLKYVKNYINSLNISKAEKEEIFKHFK